MCQDTVLFLSLMLGNLFIILNNMKAINEFEQINSQEDSINQYASYYLGAAYLKIEKEELRIKCL